MNIDFSQMSLEVLANVHSIKARRGIVGHVRVTRSIRAQFFPNVDELKLLNGCEESGAVIAACRVPLSQHTVEIACNQRMFCVVPQVVGKRIAIEALSLSERKAVPDGAYTLHSVVFCTLSAIIRPSRLLSTFEKFMYSFSAIAVPLLL